LINLYGLSHNSDTFQEVEPLQPLLMVKSSPHYLEKPFEYDQTYFSLQGFHPDPAHLIENSSCQGFQGFQEDCLKFYNPITEWLEKSYLESSIIDKKFQFFLMLVKVSSTGKDTFARSF